jgi:hypothetical protein
MAAVIARKTNRRGHAAIGVGATRFALTADTEGRRGRALRISRALDAPEVRVALPIHCALVGAVGAA